MHLPRGIPPVAAAACLVCVGAAEARADEVAIAPSEVGQVGAWLAVGPLATGDRGARASRRIDDPIVRGDEGKIAGRKGEALAGSVRGEPVWRIVSGAAPSVDLDAALGHKGGEAMALLYGVLRLDRPLRGALLVGASDGIRAWIDGTPVLSSDDDRPEREGDHVVRLDLAAGDHPVVMKLHRRSSPWALRVRVVDLALRPPRGLSVVLPGTDDADARALAREMADVSIDRGLVPEGDAYRPRVSVRFLQGAPRAADRSVRVEVTTGGAARRSLYAADAGEAPLGPSGTSDVLVRLPAIPPADLEDGRATLSARAAGRGVEVALDDDPAVRAALARADRALPLCDVARTPALRDAAVARATLELARDRIVRFVGGGDRDAEATREEARQLDAWAADLETGRDPIVAHAGPMRLSYRSPLDGALHAFGLYVPRGMADPSGGAPASDAAARRWPLVVVLHGMNGRPLSVLRWFFGHDREGRDSEWEDRHTSFLAGTPAAPGGIAPIGAFVLAPGGHGNAMYREAGEADVMWLVEWALRTLPVDPLRVGITGPSMGGTGAASIPFHFPERFAASAPLCGYHSYGIRRDIAGAALRPWERALAAERSNVAWADNGLHLPLYVWHGKRDHPVENSTVLVQRYRALGYRVSDESPDVGHDVWKKAYEDLKTWWWLAWQKRPAHPARIVFRTDSLRWADAGWVHVRGIERSLEFSSVRAEIEKNNVIAFTTSGVTALALDRDAERIDAGTPVRVRADGTTIDFAPDEQVVLYRQPGAPATAWAKGPAPDPGGPRKRARLSGPMRDVFHEPVVFVVGTDDPDQTRANLETARAWARVRPGVDLAYPILADVDLDEATEASHAIVLVGNARSNRVLREIEPRLPFRVEGGAVLGDGHEWRGDETGVAFVHPNPRHPDRYVLVLEGVDALGTLRSASLPDLLPDWIVYDRGVAPARGKIVLGAASVRDGGVFGEDWRLLR